MAAKVIILPRDRLQWHAQLVLDLGMSATALRVAILIGMHFNCRTGMTFVGYDRLAAQLGLSRATVAAAIKELKDRGHLSVTSGGGRKIANEYRMIMKTVQNSGRFERAETVQNQTVNRPEFWTTTLSYPSDKNSTRTRARPGHVFVLADSDDAEAWKRDARSRREVSPLFIEIHEGKRGRWMPSKRPMQPAGRKQEAIR